MAAIQRSRMSSLGVGAFVVAISAALIAGASGGYLVRALSSHVAAPSQAVQYERVTGDNQDLTESDLTRALPADRSTGTAQLPSWVKSYVAPAASHQFKVDQYIDSLDYAAQSGASNEVAAPALQLQP